MSDDRRLTLRGILHEITLTPFDDDTDPWPFCIEVEDGSGGVAAAQICRQDGERLRDFIIDQLAHECVGITRCHVCHEPTGGESNGITA